MPPAPKSLTTSVTSSRSANAAVNACRRTSGPLRQMRPPTNRKRVVPSASGSGSLAARNALDAAREVLDDPPVDDRQARREIVVTLPAHLEVVDLTRLRHSTGPFPGVIRLEVVDVVSEAARRLDRRLQALEQ